MNKKGIDKVSRKLALALFEGVKTIGAQDLNSADACLQSLSLNLRGNLELRSCLLNPAISHVNKVDLLLELCVQDAGLVGLPESIKPILKSFLDSALEHEAVLVMHKISNYFSRLLEAQNHLAAITVVSAFEYSADDRQNLEQRLADDLGLTPKITWEIDKDLIGGAVVKLHDQILDSSVRGALNNLKEALL